MFLDAIELVGAIYLVTADHGNAKDMVNRDKSGKPQLDKNGKVQFPQLDKNGKVQFLTYTIEPVNRKINSEI